MKHSSCESAKDQKKELGRRDEKGMKEEGKGRDAKK